MLRDYECLGVNNKLIWNFRDIGHTMRHISESRGSQKRILIMLYETGPITQSALTAQLKIQSGSVSEVLGKLEAAGFIIRSPSESDRRTTDVLLTEEGKRAAEEADAQKEKRHVQMFACLTEEEKAALLSLLEKVNADWDQQYRQNSAAQNLSDSRTVSRGHRCADTGE